MAKIRVLYDGWPLVYAPNSPAALHLECLLALHPMQMEAHLALPGMQVGYLPEPVVRHSLPNNNSEAGKLRWEQISLPGLAKKIEARLIHLTSSMPSLRAARASLISPTGEIEPSGLLIGMQPPQMSFAQRLRTSLGEGGLTGLGGRLWPDDLPDPQQSAGLIRLPAVVTPGFGQPAQTTPEMDDLALPDTYVLAQPGDEESGLRRLLATWSWAAGALGENYPLLLAGLSTAGNSLLSRLLKEYKLENSARALPYVNRVNLAALYQNCSAFLHTGNLAAWGDPARLALASGRPLVGFENRWMDVMAGPAAYLVHGDGSSRESCRLLGAALVTVVIEDSVAESLSQAAYIRAQPWLKAGPQFTRKLGEIYEAHSA